MSVPTQADLVESFETLLIARDCELDHEDFAVRVVVGGRGWHVEVAPDFEDHADPVASVDVVLRQDMDDREVVMAAAYVLEAIEECLAA